MCLLVAVHFHSQFALGYTYDAAGNRIEKKYTKGTETHYTWYVPDAQGNVMGVYEKKGTTTVRNTETHLGACPDEVRRRQQQAWYGQSTNKEISACKCGKWPCKCKSVYLYPRRKACLQAGKFFETSQIKL